MMLYEACSVVKTHRTQYYDSFVWPEHPKIPK
jgi:hypothetical protein